MLKVYQPRYMLPLFAVFLLMRLAPTPPHARTMRGRRVGSESFAALQHRWPRGHGPHGGAVGDRSARALLPRHRSYAFGRTLLLQLPHRPGDAKPERGRQWWWPTAYVGPMTVWWSARSPDSIAIALAAYL